MSEQEFDLYLRLMSRLLRLSQEQEAAIGRGKTSSRPLTAGSSAWLRWPRNLPDKQVMRRSASLS